MIMSKCRFNGKASMLNYRIPNILTYIAVVMLFILISFSMVIYVQAAPVITPSHPLITIQVGAIPIILTAPH